MTCVMINGISIGTLSRFCNMDVLAFCCLPVYELSNDSSKRNRHVVTYEQIMCVTPHLFVFSMAPLHFCIVNANDTFAHLCNTLSHKHTHTQICIYIPFPSKPSFSNWHCYNAAACIHRANYGRLSEPRSSLLLRW